MSDPNITVPLFILSRGPPLPLIIDRCSITSVSLCSYLTIIKGYFTLIQNWSQTIRCSLVSYSAHIFLVCGRVGGDSISLQGVQLAYSKPHQQDKMLMKKIWSVIQTTNVCMWGDGIHPMWFKLALHVHSSMEFLRD